MALADLVKDVRLVSTSKDADVRGLTADFVLRRVRRLVELNPADADPARRGDITTTATRALADLIARDLPKVQAAAEEMWRRVSVDAAHLPIDPVTQRKRGTKRPPSTLKAARAQRRRLVRSIAFQAAAQDITLADPAGFESAAPDLRPAAAVRRAHGLRRRQGRAQGLEPRPDREPPRRPVARWLRAPVRYPRIPASLFARTCRPDSSGRCSPPMNEWGYPPGDIHVQAAVRANPSIGASWLRKGDELDFVAGAGVNAVTAVQKLFQPSSDFLARNLMMCDQTLHALHLEALVFAMTKRGRGNAWLDAEVAANGARWLRIQPQLGNPGRYLGGPDESLFFEHVSVRQADLQVGDHLIVYNHPAYAETTAGVWRLENAVVVQTFPELLMQGHGSAVSTRVRCGRR